jgi:hypothetical protein
MAESVVSASLLSLADLMTDHPDNIYPIQIHN